MQLQRQFLVSLVVLFVTAASPSITPSAQGDEGDGKKFSVVDQQGKHADIRIGDQPVLRYVYQRDTSDKQRDFDTAKVFAHVIGPDGEEPLTSGPGGKLFPHHRGIFIGWNKIRHDGETHDLWHVRNTVQKHRSLEQQADDDGAQITAEIEWIGNDGETLIREKRTHRLTRSDDAYAIIDLTSELTAVAGDLVLDGDPEHAGVQFRPSQKVGENKSARYTFHAEGIDPTQDLDLPWVACSFRIDDTQWTVQHLRHRSNPSGARWSAYRDYGRFGPFPVIELAEGETKTLRYRLRVTEGAPPSREQLAEAAANFSK